MKYVIASNNADKLRELRDILSALGIEAVGMGEAGFYGEIEETGDTFEANALIKAEAVMRATGLPAIADDSGLVIDALGGAPGVYSARYAEPGLRKKKVLGQMADIPEDRRKARFVSAVACAFPYEEPIIVRGTCEGSITHECRGSGGFGYDSIFLVPEFDKTFAELSAAVKNNISHRAIALTLLKEKLKVKMI